MQEKQQLCQELFEKMFNHLYTQGGLSVSYDTTSLASNYTCRYRGNDGVKCAIGALISDENYDLSLERKGISYPEVFDAVVKSHPNPLISETQGFLITMQAALHDDIAFANLDERQRTMSAAGFRAALVHHARNCAEVCFLNVDFHPALKLKEAQHV